MKRPDQIKREFVRQWLHKADLDLAAARVLAAERIELGFSVGFHCHQAVEKFAKAVLVWHQIEFPKTHDLERLSRLLENADATVAAAVLRASELTTYAVDARYPSELPEPTAVEASHALNLAEAVSALVHRSLLES